MANPIDCTECPRQHVGMPKRYEFFEHTADIGVYVYGSTVEELFRNGASALYSALGKLKLAQGVTRKLIKLEASPLENLFHDWLAELLYELETHHLLYNKIEVRDLKHGTLTAQVCGGTIDFQRSETSQEIKAVTYHQLAVKQTRDGSWQATVIFDV